MINQIHDWEVTTDWKVDYLKPKPSPRKPAIRFHKEELDYVANEVAAYNQLVPGKTDADKVGFLRKHMLDNAYELLNRKDITYIETFGYGVRKSDVWDEDPNGTHIVECYVHPCFIRDYTWADYDGERIL